MPINHERGVLYSCLELSRTTNIPLEKINKLINKPIDLVFIDGDHSIRGCMNDFALLYPYVSTGGYIVLHDIYPEHCGYEGPRYIIDHCIKKSS